MGKRKIKAVESGESVGISPSKVSKKNKNKQEKAVPTPPVVAIEKNSPKTPKKNKDKKLKAEKLNASTASSEKSSPGKKNKAKNHKRSKHDSVSEELSEENVTISPKKKQKHKKQKRDSKVVVEVDEQDEDVYEAKEEAEEIEDNEVIDGVIIKTDEDVEIDLLEIPKVDLEVLLNGIKKLLPETDNVTPKVRAKKLNWEKVAFGDYTPDKCSKIWDAIQKRQRQYRYMSEFIQDAMIWLDTPWRHANQKSTKNHPDYPKRPKSAFLLFLEDAKTDITRENKNAKITEIARIAGLKYKQLSGPAKQVYLDQASVAMRKFEERVEEFYQKYPHLKAEVVPKYLGPKKPRTPFVMFFEDHLSKEEHVADKNAYKMASKAAWNNMSVKKKLPWIRSAIAEHKKYLDEVEVYNFEHPNETVKPVKTVLNKEEILVLNKADGKPLKPPLSSYLLYSQQLMKTDEYATVPSKDRVKAIAAKWALVSKDEKEVYEQKLHQMQEKYNKDFKVYLDKLPEEEREKILLEMDKTKKKKIEKPKKEKRQSLSKREAAMQAVPQHWQMMTEGDKQVYLTAVQRVRDYFENKLNESIKVDSVPEENASDNDDDDDVAEDEELEKAKIDDSGSGESDSAESVESDSD